ncbi:class I mannose-6-phosphate isomerase [Sphingobium sp.]|uniref:class I mannose-6-phosphate isomerase n=1 Tax=Sphingobium sp. TaxID=1912891 RepID=UPI003BB594F7
MSVDLPIRRVAKPWGCDVLPPPFARDGDERIGEIWFEPPPQLPQLLVKYIFTSENLSVQVHPSDAQTQADGLGRQGKEECWLIVDAQPGAKLGIGFDAPIDADAMRAAALDGSIEHLMSWHAVKPGDFFYIPANTVHAIGAGISLIEVQQNSDITYRLYDYGRPRELHLDKGIAVASGVPYPDRYRASVPGHGEVTLVSGPLFRLDRIEGTPSAGMAAHYGEGPFLVVPQDGEVMVRGEAVAPGSCALVAAMAELMVPAGAKALLAQAGI